MRPSRYRAKGPPVSELERGSRCGVCTSSGTSAVGTQSVGHAPKYLWSIFSQAPGPLDCSCHQGFPFPSSANLAWRLLLTRTGGPEAYEELTNGLEGMARGMALHSPPLHSPLYTVAASPSRLCAATVPPTEPFCWRRDKRTRVTCWRNMFRAHCALNSNSIPCLVAGSLVTGCTGCIQANNTLYLLLMVIGHLEISRLLCDLRSMYVYFHVLTEPEATRESW